MSWRRPAEHEASLARARLGTAREPVEPEAGPSLLPKFVDGAFALAVITAILYFMGMANSTGDSAALNLPRAIFEEDIWATVSSGAESLLMLVTAPVAAPQFFSQWRLFLLFLAFPFALCVLCWFVRKRHVVWLVCCLVAGTSFVFILVMFLSFSMSVDRIQSANACFQGQCKGSVRVMVLHIKSDKDSQTEERAGVIFSATHRNFILLTAQGVLVVPVGNVQKMESMAAH